MPSVTVSAPGKLMLLGEHAVVYGHYCLVTAVDQRMRATVTILQEPVLELEAADVKVSGYRKELVQLGKGEIPKGAAFVELAVRNMHERYTLPSGIRIETKSEFSSSFGFGSSSASTVCVIKALSELLELDMDARSMFDVAYQTILDVQGKGSGFDAAAAIYGGTLYFQGGGRSIEPIDTADLSLVVGYSGFKADTVTLIDQVRMLSEQHPEMVDWIYRSIGKIVNEAKTKCAEKDWAAVGRLMNFNQGLLESLGVSSLKLATMIHASREAGALGAKLSGAGKGDCMIALATPKTRSNVEKAIVSAGGEVLQVSANAEGVRVE